MALCFRQVRSGFVGADGAAAKGIVAAVLLYKWRLDKLLNFLFASITKKKSKKTLSQLQKNTIGEEQNPSSAPRNSGSEIDEIFARKKKSAVEKAEKLGEVTEKSDRQKKNDTIGEEQNPSSAPKKLGSEIDEIFAGKKRKKSEVGKAKPNEVTKKTDRKKTNDRKKIKGRDDGEFVDRPSRPRKRTEDGLTLYTEEELGFNKGDAGGTPLCPFDCSCCF